jgi:hypothetical protein
MKKIKFLSLAVAALVMAACSSDEIASVAQKGSAPLEIVPVVKTQTRAAQITMDNLTALTVDVTGTFVTADGTDVVNPVLTLAKSGSTWSYTYNGDNAGPLYWPNNAETATFSAHTLADGAAVNELTAQTDVVGDYTTKAFDGTNNPGAVALELKHAVSKMQFKARIQGEAADELKVKIDIKQVAVRAMNYAATYAKPAAAEATMGVLALGDSPAKADLTVASASAGTFITLNTTDATASTDLGHLFMVPQTVTAETLSESTWDDSYIAVYAQIRTVQGDVETMVFPTVGAVDETSYAWVAVPMPSDFTQMQAHHKYIFTINFSADALGKVDRNQEPVIPGGGEDIEIEGRSSQPVTVTVENVYDFEEGGDVDVNQPPFDPLTTPLTFEAREDGIYIHCEFEYSKNGGDWIKDDGASFSLNKGETVSFRANMSKVEADFFSCYGKCYVYGNVMSLLNAEDYATNYSMSDEAFYRLFEDKDIDIHPEKDLVLPATTLTKRCYYRMFANQDGLTKAPKLPATTLADGCYGHMFQFCEKLTTAPELPATTLVANCYEKMFIYCSSLSSIKCLATSGINENGSTDKWLNSVAATGTFTKASGATWPEGINGIPSGWTTEAE